MLVGFGRVSTSKHLILLRDCLVLKGHLAHYDVNRPLKLLWCISLWVRCLFSVQNGWWQPEAHCIQYASRTLSKAEQAYAQIEREGLALVFGVRRFHQYLYGRPFVLVTDHRPLCKIFESKQGILPMAAAWMQRWALTLSAYQYTIEFINGTANHCADCMSRLPLSGQMRDSAEKIHMVIQKDELPVMASQGI